MYEKLGIMNHVTFSCSFTQFADISPPPTDPGIENYSLNLTPVTWNSLTTNHSIFLLVAILGSIENNSLDHEPNSFSRLGAVSWASFGDNC